MSALVVVLAVLSCYRLTMLVTIDEILEPARENIVDWFDGHGHPKLATLCGCPWCMSAWVGFPVAWSADQWGDERWWQVVSVALAASAVTGVIATHARP